ncbi:MAG: 50S ribosomal protein L6 [Acidobacteria bacterium]|nr:50S ribosomal protein L6 [Acidobacteriota bacterium]
MSRVGKKPIPLPKDVKVNVTKTTVEVQGPKGTLTTPLPYGIRCAVENGRLQAERSNNSKSQMALHGLVRSLLANAVTGVTQGFKRELDIVGIGFKADVKKDAVLLSLGYSHPIEYPVPRGITITVEKVARPIQNYVGTLIVEGSDRQKVGQVAADIRSLRNPDPYKGKGVRYVGEQIKLKVGKKGA